MKLPRLIRLLTSNTKRESKHTSHTSQHHQIPLKERNNVNQSTSIHPPESPASDVTFSIILKGIQHNVSPAEATTQLATLFKVSPEQAANLLARPSYTVKKAVSLTMASQYKRAIEAAGGVCDMISDNVSALSIDITLPAPVPLVVPNGLVPASSAPSSAPPSPHITATMVSDLSANQPTKNTMHNIAELKEKLNTKTLHLVLLTIATFGIYPLLWLTRHYETFNRITKKPTIDMNNIVWMAVCLGIGSSLSGSHNETINLIVLLSFLTVSILEIVWAFKAKAALQEYVLNEFKIELRMNAFYTFGLTIFYINYCINDLPEVLRKNQILRGQTAA